MFFVLILGDGMTRLEFLDRIDRQTLELLAAHRTTALDRAFTYVTWAGSSFLLLPLTFAVAVIISYRNHVQEAFFLILSFIGGSLLNNIAKHIIARPRPVSIQPVLDAAAGYSFPSSHAFQVTAFVVSLIVVRTSFAGASWYRGAQVLGGLVVFAVCLSRIYLQVHYPSDVVAGFLVSLFWVLGLAALMMNDDYDWDDSFCSQQVTGG